MGKSRENNLNYSYIIKAIILGLAVTALSVFLFAIFMFLTEKGYEFSAVFGTAAVSLGSFVAAFYISRKRQSKGLLTGLITGIAVFLLVTVISLIVDKGTITLNTLFHLIIFLLSSLIGSALGVNKKENRKYI